MIEEKEVFITLSILFLFKILSLKLLNTRHKNEWWEAGVLKDTRIYPLKSGTGWSLANAKCQIEGIQVHTDGRIIKDRSWLVYDTKLKRMVTARQKPQMVKVESEIKNGKLFLKAPSSADLILPIDAAGRNIIDTDVFGDEVQGEDYGDEAANWFGKLLKGEEEEENEGGRYRLMGWKEGVKTRWLQQEGDKYRERAREIDFVTYQDGYPYLLATSSSVEEVARRVKRETDPMQPDITSYNFRPNLYIQTEFEAFDEDDWEEIKIGECLFKNIKPCDRCVLTTVDPLSGRRRKDNQPLKTLRSFRLHEDFGRSPCFGINLIVLKPGEIHTGEKVFIKRRAS